MVYSNHMHCHRVSCSVMLELGSRAPVVIKWPAVVLVIWPHFNGNAQRCPRGASLGFALFSSRICCFLCTSHGCPRGNQIGRGAAEKPWAGFRDFWSALMGVFLVYVPVYVQQVQLAGIRSWSPSARRRRRSQGRWPEGCVGELS